MSCSKHNFLKVITFFIFCDHPLVHAGNIEEAGIRLCANEKTYTVTNQECPGGIFFTQPTDGQSICLKGRFTTENYELGNNNEYHWDLDLYTFESHSYRCEMWTGDSIRAIHPLTPASNPWGSTLSVHFARKLSVVPKQYSGWRKYNIDLLSSHNKVLQFNSSITSSLRISPILDTREVRFWFCGKLFCYTGWKSALNSELVIDADFCSLSSEAPGEIESCEMHINETTPITNIDELNIKFLQLDNGVRISLVEHHHFKNRGEDECESTDIPLKEATEQENLNRNTNIKAKPIWDGLAYCLHAHFNTEMAYYTNESLWGVTPDLYTLFHGVSFENDKKYKQAKTIFLS